METAPLFSIRYIILHAAGTDRAGTWTVTRQMYFVQAQFGQDVVGLLELSLAFAREADDDVTMHGRFRHNFTHTLNQSAIRFTCITAFHIFENFIIARLNRDFDLRHHFGQIGHSMQNAVRHVVGMAGEKTNALKPVNIINHAQ